MLPAIAAATGCSSTRRRSAGRGAAASSSSASPTATRWRSSGSRPDPATACRSPTAYLELAEDEAWLLSDATPTTRPRPRLRRTDRFAPLRPGARRPPGGRAWFRYAPAAPVRPDPGRQPTRAPRSRSAAPRSVATPAAGSPRRTRSCASSVGDQRVGKQMIRSSPISGERRRARSTRAWPGVAHLLVPRVQREPERRRIAALGLAASPDRDHPLGDLVRRQEHVVELVGVLDRIARGHPLAVAADDDRDARLLEALRDVVSRRGRGRTRPRSSRGPARTSRG